ncbi:transcriptional repressor [Campylobacterota bacterium]|nr:transcriptional repressor [Campylobacterota bacterium]
MNYKQLLNRTNLKATPQRLRLLEILGERGHMTIDAIYQTLKVEAPMLSLSTVYNNLATLCEKQIIREVSFAGASQVYELSRGEHAHLICKHCGEILDIAADYNAIKKTLILPAGTVLLEGDLIFSGACAKCAKAIEYVEVA